MYDTKYFPSTSTNFRLVYAAGMNPFKYKDDDDNDQEQSNNNKFSLIESRGIPFLCDELLHWTAITPKSLINYSTQSVSLITDENELTIAKDHQIDQFTIFTSTL